MAVIAASEQWFSRKPVNLRLFTYRFGSSYYLAGMIRTPIILLVLLVAGPAFAQFQENFDTIDQLDPGVWTGDLDLYIINAQKKLQLKAMESGSATLFRKTNLPDSLEIGLYFRLDFSPSASNKLKIFLQMDTTDMELASGYYLEIGENGSGDRIRFIRQIHGEPLVIGEGTEGSFSTDPVECQLRIIRDSDGFWTVQSRKPGDGIFLTELELFDSTLKRYYDQYFGFECQFTSTRIDKFFFDDISISAVVPDTMAPQLLSTTLSGDRSLVLVFDELLDKASAIDPGNYRLVADDVYPEAVFFNEYKPYVVRLDFPGPFQSNFVYKLEISGLKDLKGNLSDTSIGTSFFLKEKPLEKDLVINEILFDPVEDGPDFLELINRSQKILALEGLIIRNQNNNDENTLSTDLSLFPGQIVAICPDTTLLKMRYSVPDSARLLESDLPAFSNDSGNASLWIAGMDSLHCIDSFDYDESMHFDLIRDPEGISLERMSPGGPANDPANWHSASTLCGGATPGYRNSQAVDSVFIPEETFISLASPVFSPDNNGYQDQLIIAYELPAPDHVLSIDVFDVQGRHIHRMVNNELAGMSGFVTWNGLDENGRVLPAGPYVLACLLYSGSGKSHRKKLVAYLVVQM